MQDSQKKSPLFPVGLVADRLVSRLQLLAADPWKEEFIEITLKFFQGMTAFTPVTAGLPFHESIELQPKLLARIEKDELLQLVLMQTTSFCCAALQSKIATTTKGAVDNALRHLNTHGQVGNLIHHDLRGNEGWESANTSFFNQHKRQAML